MAMGKSVRVSGVTDKRDGYSVLIEQRGSPGGLLVFSNNCVARLSIAEIQEVRAEQQYDQLCDCYAVLGNLSHGGEHHVLLVTGIVSVGRLGMAEVYRVTQVRSVSLSGGQRDSDRLTEVLRLLAGGAAYFSWSNQGRPVDLTLSAQRQAGQGAGAGSCYLWSRLLSLPYTRAGAGAWLVDLMLGSVDIRTVYVGASQVRAALIAFGFWQRILKHLIAVACEKVHIRTIQA